MNKNIGIIIAIVIVAIAAIAVVASRPSNKMDPAMNMTNTGNSSMNSQQQSTEVKSGTATVDIKDFDFHTKTLRVKAGTKVTWTNQDDAKHDINPDTGNFEGSGKLLAKGESYSFTFETPGTYAYHCTPHPYMKASVEVVE